MLKQGPPPENTRQRKTLVYIRIFVVLGFIISLFIIIFSNSLTQVKLGLEDIFGFGIVNAISTLLMTIPISLIQTAVLKENISKSKITPFIVYAAVGGLVGGFIGGQIMVAINYFQNLYHLNNLG